MAKRILITGGSGFIGRQLVSRWLEAGHQITVLTRKPDRLKQQLPQIEVSSCFMELDQPYDWVINLAGEGIAFSRWTPERKQLLRDSRIETTLGLVSWARATNQQFEVVLSGSAIGYYGAFPGETSPALMETDSCGDDFAAHLCLDWEVAASAIEPYTKRLAFLRTGVVLGRQGGLLAQVMTPFKLGLGGKLGNGEQILSWIHQEDYCEAVDFIIGSHLSGPVNMTAPLPVSNSEFTKKLAHKLHRPAFFPVPATVARILFGEMSDLIIKGQRVLPHLLLESGFSFKYPTIDSAIKSI